MENPIPLVITVFRKWFTDKSTIGELYVGMERVCYTLEDTVRRDGKKIYGKTAIPLGRYEMVLNYSNRFKRFLPLLLNVKNFDGVRLHTGNRPDQTEGCILIGKSRNDDQPDMIFESRAAFKELMEKVEPVFKTTKVYVEITEKRDGIDGLPPTLV